jgi:hypothetical protein
VQPAAANPAASRRSRRSAASRRRTERGDESDRRGGGADLLRWARGVCAEETCGPSALSHFQHSATPPTQPHGRTRSGLFPTFALPNWRSKWSVVGCSVWNRTDTLRKRGFATLALVREESQIEEMRAALRGDRERAEARRRPVAGVAGDDRAAPARPPGRPARRSWLGRLLRRGRWKRGQPDGYGNSQVVQRREGLRLPQARRREPGRLRPPLRHRRYRPQDAY